MTSRRSLRVARRSSLALLCLTGVLLSSASALAGSAGILPFTSSRGVPNGAADNISSLVSTEVDIRGGYDLVLSASSDEVAVGCGERTACVHEYGRESGFSHVITGTVSAAGSSRYTLVLTLYKVGSNTAVRQVLNTLDRSPDSLLEGIPDLVVELLTGQRPVRDDDAPTQASNTKAGLFNDGDDFNDELSSSDDDEPDSREDQDERKWMERDRHGRLTQPVGGEDDPLGLDEIDDLDLDLDELSSDHQTKKRAARSEREAAARAAHAEEERLAQVARDEREKRRREQEIRGQAEERERDRLRREEKQRITEEREQRLEEEQRRSREEERREQDRERARAEERSERERERARERAREEERRDREIEASRSEERRAQEIQRERREEEERERREELERYQDDDEEDLTIDAGIIIIESDQEDEEADEEDGEFGILIEEGDDEEPDYNRSDDRDYRDYRDERDDRDYRDERDDRDYRDERDDRDYRDEPNDDSRRSAKGDRDGRSRSTDRNKRGSGGGYGSTRNERSQSSRSGGYGTARDDGGRARGGKARTTQSGSKTGRPQGAIRAFVGYNYYYLSFLKLGLEGSIYVLPALSLDFGVEAWMLWLREGEDLHLAARVLPNFLVGASYRMNVHHVVKPFVGGDVGTVIYAQKVEVAGSAIIARTPLFALVVAAKGGAEFELPKNFGLFVSARVGVSISGDLEQDGLADIQQYVNETWSPTRVFFNAGFGARYRF